MRVIGVLNSKGGVGKTTVAMHLARALQLGGHSVVVADADPQGSAGDWAAASDDQQVPVVGIKHPRDLKALASNDFVVLDGPPRLGDMAGSIVRASDFILLPCGASPLDIWACSDLVDLVKQCIEMTDGATKAAFVISRSVVGTRLSREIAEALSGYNLPVLKTSIRQRQAYPAAAAGGATVFDTDPNGAAAADFISLRDEIIHLLT